MAASLGIGAVGASGTASAAPTPQAAAARDRHASEGRGARQSGFTPVRQLGTRAATGTPVAMTAPARGVVFVLVEGPGRRAEVHRITTSAKKGRHGSTTSVTRYKLGAELGDPGRATIDGTSASDVWASASGRLWRFDGRRFTQVALPKGESAVTVADAPGRGVYVGTESKATGGQVWRGSVGRRGTSWTSEGHASREGFEERGLPVLALRVVDGRVFALWAQQYSANLGRAVYELDSGSWAQRYLANTLHPGGGTTSYTWLTPKAGHHVVLGRDENPSGRPPVFTTSEWDGTGLRQCLRGPVSDQFSEVGALLADGRLVTSDFRIRADACNRPRPASGDPGDETLAMAAERGGNTAWALTRHGERLTLQRFAG